MKDQFKKILNSNLFIYFVIAIGTLFVSRWLFTSTNFFVFDDWHNLVDIPKRDYLYYFQIVPTMAYCSRPVGQVIVKVLLDLFGYQYIYHLLFMIMIHILNACLAYKIIQKLFSNKSVAVISALIFAMYPVSTMPSYWEAAMFDLFGTTLVLISSLFFLKLRDCKKKDPKRKKILYATLMIVFYYISLRSKEMFIGLPVLFFFIDACDSLKKAREKKEKWNFKEFLKSCIPLFIMMAVMVFYAFCILRLNSSNEFTTNEADAYFYSFNIIEIIKNYFRYLFIYFNPHSLVYADVPSVIHYSLFYKYFIVLLAIVVVGITIYQLIHNQYHYFIAIVSYSLFIAPVLPMPNLHAVWYLYIPALPLAFICATFLYQFLKLFVYKERLLIASILCSLVGLIFVNRLNCIHDFRIWWMEFANHEYQTFYYFKDLEEQYPDIEHVFVVNVPDEYTTFFIEDGGIINVAYYDFDLDVDILPDSDYTCQDNSLVVDYNDYDFQLLQEGGSCNE